MQTITLELPDELISSGRRSPEEFGRALRLAVAIFWYERGEISQEKAATLADLDRTDFLLALAGEQMESILIDWDDLRRELARA